MAQLLMSAAATALLLLSTCYVVSTKPKGLPQHLISGNTIMRQNYGIIFEQVGRVLVGTGETVYQHTVGIPLKKNEFELQLKLKPMPCDTDAMRMVKCKLINEMINSSAGHCLNTIRDTYRFYLLALGMVPKLHRASGYTNIRPSKNGKGRRTVRNRRRRRRNVYKDLYIPSAFTNFTRGLPGSKMASSIATGLFGLPSEQTVDTLAKHIDMVNNAVAEVLKGVQSHQDELESVQVHWHNKLDSHKELSINVSREIGQTTDALNSLRESDAETASTFTKKTKIFTDVLDKINTVIIPNLFLYRTTCDEMIDSVNSMAVGILELNRGYLSPALVTTDMLTNVVNDITNVVLNTAKMKLTGTKLVHKSPLFYYQTHGMTSYTRDDKLLYIHIEFPMYSVGGLLKTYRIHTFDVDVSSGLNERATAYNTNPKNTNSDAADGVDNHPLSFGRTRVTNVPDYLAISADSEYYAEMDYHYYKSCKFDDKRSGSLHMCKNMIPAMQHSSVKNCATALYSDAAEFIKKRCKFLHTDKVHEGSALQIGHSNLFMVQASTRESDVWTMNCPLTNMPVRDVVPKVFALMVIPCYCSLSAKGFYLPFILSGCSTDPLLSKDDGAHILTSHVNFHMGVNAFILHSFIDGSSYSIDMNDIGGDSIQDKNELWPSFKSMLKPLKIAIMKYSMSWDDVIKSAQKYQLDMSKAARLVNKRVTVWSKEIDVALNKSMDFKDLDAEQKGPLKAFKDLLNIFPGGCDLVAALSSPGFLCFISLCISVVSFFSGIAKSDEKIAVIMDMESDFQEEEEQESLL